MAKIIPFPGRRPIAATPIPRAEFERLADLALDVVDCIIALLDQHDGDADREDDGTAEPALASPERPMGPQLIWCRGSDSDAEL